MGTGYTRADTANNIANGKVADADDLDAEFNAIEAAFDENTGHSHDGTSDEGGPITVIGPAQDFIAESARLRPKTNDTYDLGSATFSFKDGYFLDFYVDGIAYLDSVRITSGQINNTTIGNTTPAAITGTTITANTGFVGPITGNLTATTASVSGTFTVGGVEVFNSSSGHNHDGTAGNGAPITVIGPAQDVITSGTAVYPKTDDAYDLGSPTNEWKDLYIDGTANIDNIQVSSGQINNTIIGNTTPAAITGTIVTATTGFVGNITGNVNGSVTGNLTATTASVSGTLTLGGTAITSTATQINYLNTTTSNVQTQLNNKQPLNTALTSISGITWTANKIPRTIGTNNFSALNFLDEDDMASNDASGLPSQQSVKAYVDSFSWQLVETLTPTTGDETVENSSDFEDGYDYALRFVDFNWDNSDAGTRSPFLEIATATGNGTFHSSSATLVSNDANAAMYGWVYLIDPRNSSTLQEIENETVISAGGIMSGSTVTAGNVNNKVIVFHQDTAFQVYGVRIGRNGTAAFDLQNTGSVEIYRRRNRF